MVLSGGDEQAIERVAVDAGQEGCSRGNRARNGQLAQSVPLKDGREPLINRPAQPQFARRSLLPNLEGGNGGGKQTLARGQHGTGRLWGNRRRVRLQPEQDAGVQQHHRHSCGQSSSVAGSVESKPGAKVTLSDGSGLSGRRRGAWRALISATGLPLRQMRTTSPFSSTAASSFERLVLAS